MGASHVSDEHVLLAIAFGGHSGAARLESFDVDPDEVVAGLRARGVQAPPLQPPAAPTPSGPQGPWVYFPKKDWSAVTQELVKDFPPGTSHWGTNKSKWKRDHWYVVGEDHIPMEAIVRRVVKDRGSVEVLPYDNLGHGLLDGVFRNQRKTKNLGQRSGDRGLSGGGCAAHKDNHASRSFHGTIIPDVHRQLPLVVPGRKVERSALGALGPRARCGPDL